MERLQRIKLGVFALDQLYVFGMKPQLLLGCS
jgi:hypothetical protein